MDSEWRQLLVRGIHEDVLARNMVSLSACAWLVYEALLNLQDEVKFVWRGSMTGVKVLYLFGRYAGIATQCANVFLVFSTLSITPVSRQACLAWFIYLASGSVALLLALDIVLMLRVHALYNRQKKVGALFTALLVTQVVLVYVCCRKTLPLVPFGNTCDVLDCPHQVVILMAGVMVTHIILLFMALAKRSLASSSSSVVHMIVRDGAWVFTLIVSLWVTIVPYSLFMKTSKPHLIFLWPMAFMSVTICRLILSLHKLPRTTNSQNLTHAEIQFTSCIYLSDSTPLTYQTDSLSLSTPPTSNLDSAPTVAAPPQT